jgi:hypothetical protein
MDDHQSTYLIKLNLKKRKKRKEKKKTKGLNRKRQKKEKKFQNRAKMALLCMFYFWRFFTHVLPKRKHPVRTAKKAFSLGKNCKIRHIFRGKKSHVAIFRQ